MAQAAQEEQAKQDALQDQFRSNVLEAARKVALQENAEKLMQAPKQLAAHKAAQEAVPEKAAQNVLLENVEALRESPSRGPYLAQKWIRTCCKKRKKTDEGTGKRADAKTTEETDATDTRETDTGRGNSVIARPWEL